MSPNLGRRQMLRVLGTGAAGLLVSRRAIAQQAQLGLPPPRRLRGRRLEPGLVQAELTAAATRVRVADAWAELWTYGGSFPGPLLRVREGDRVRLRLTNQLPEETNLHLHGLHIPPAVDNPFLAVPPGEAATYEFDVPRGSRGLHWYHPHVHGRVARQLFAGLAGPILVEPATAEFALSGAEEHILVLKDLELDGDRPAPHLPPDWRRGKEGSLRLVNGTLDPVLVATRGALRLHILNASNARYYRLALQEHAFHLLATDGHALATPVVVEEILLAPGERAEVLVLLERQGTFALLDLPYDRGAAMMMGGMGGTGVGREAVQLMTLVRRTERAPRLLPTALATVEDFRGRPADVTRGLVLGEAMMGARFSINGKEFDPTRVDLASRLGNLEIWEIENRGGMDHPFHLHTYPFQVLSRNGVAESAVVWKDVVNVRRSETVQIAVPLRDFAGRTVYHCHIAEHEDQGMMGTLDVAPG